MRVEQIGGFRLPFISLGSVLVLVGVVSYFVLPPQNGTLLTRSTQLFRLFWAFHILTRQ